MNFKKSALEPRWLLIFSFFVAGIFLGGLVIYIYLASPTTVGTKIHPIVRNFRYVNPLLAVDLFPSQQFSQNVSLSLALEGLINSAKKNNDIADAGIYFRDIEPGLWVGINDDIQFSPGKLLKIPIMIAYFKLAESDPAVLNEQLTYRGPDTNAGELYPTPDPLVVGQPYTASDLIERMVVNYDNNAANLLFDNMDKDALNEIFSDLGINFKENKETQDFISLKQYSLFFRVLYNATYLNREFSEKALEILVKSPSTDFGLGLELPKVIDFANRFGAYKLKTGKSQIEMYDCGIAYYPIHPYMICAVARGSNTDSVQKFMSEISKAVLADVNYKYRQL